MKKVWFALGLIVVICGLSRCTQTDEIHPERLVVCDMHGHGLIAQRDSMGATRLYLLPDANRICQALKPKPAQAVPQKRIEPSFRMAPPDTGFKPLPKMHDA